MESHKPISVFHKYLLSDTIKMCITTKKRKSSSVAGASPDGKKSYDELEAELLDTKAKLVETQKDLADTEAKLEKALLQIKNAEAQEDGNDEEFSDEEQDATDPWNVKYKELRGYRVINGHCNVPQKYSSNPKLGQWVKWQRQCYAKLKNGNSQSKNLNSQERISMLEGIGFSRGKSFPPIAT